MKRKLVERRSVGTSISSRLLPLSCKINTFALVHSGLRGVVGQFYSAGIFFLTKS